MTEIDSYELAQWRAFERVNGPLGHQYSDDMLANIHEQLQACQFILGRLSAGDESPVPMPHRVLRPHEVMSQQPEEIIEARTQEAEVEALKAALIYQNRIDAEKSQTVEELKSVAQHLPGT